MRPATKVLAILNRAAFVEQPKDDTVGPCYLLDAESYHEACQLLVDMDARSGRPDPHLRPKK